MYFVAMCVLKLHRHLRVHSSAGYAPNLFGRGVASKAEAFEHSVYSQILDLWLSWLERFVYIEEVSGSNPDRSTK